MTAGLDAVQAATEPRESLIRYLLTAYPLRDPHLRYGFEQLLREPGAVAQDPYLEGTQPYQSGATLLQLVEQGVLHPGLLRLFDPNRPLYTHQERAIRSAVQDGENIVVATGTGSGKTECFAIPMLDHLLRTPRRGVQALILYPMNALVNDQVKRLRLLLSRQNSDHELIRFGFYTSRTETKETDGVASLRAELVASDREELLELLPTHDRDAMARRPSSELVEAAMQRILKIQLVSREQIWANPPQILVTNYSMLEHMLVRPTERTQIFERSPDFRLLVVDEAHTYNGSTGTEVSMLIRRFKVAVGLSESGVMQGIATSATLGDPSQADTPVRVKDFASQLFDEPFQQVIWGDRMSVEERLRPASTLPDGLDERELYEVVADLELPALDAPVEVWCEALKAFVTETDLGDAKSKAGCDLNRFLWEAFDSHPLMHRLIKCLAMGPRPWRHLAESPELWPVPTCLDGAVVPQEVPRLEKALSNLIQIGTHARISTNQLPLVPVRLHLLFRSIEGLHACVDPNCYGAIKDPNQTELSPRWGRLYLNSKEACESCNGPVIELSSCRKCGEAFGLTLAKAQLLQTLPRSLETLEIKSDLRVLVTALPESITSDEDSGEEVTDAAADAESGDVVLNGGCQPTPVILTGATPPETGWTLRIGQKGQVEAAWPLQWIRPKNANQQEGGMVSCCPACGASRGQSSPLSRFVSFTDAPLEVMLDTLFELLPESGPASAKSSRRKMLTFSDGRQDAAFFASDFQRTHTENLYRQVVWQSFQVVSEKGGVPISEVEEEIVRMFLRISIPHPDRNEELHHRSYVTYDDEHESRRLSPDRCSKLARQRAREVLLREFGLPSARRFSMESLGMLTCHLYGFRESLVENVVKAFELKGEQAEAIARIFLFSFTDLIRLLGAVDIEGSSRYFSETGGQPARRIPATLDAEGRPLLYLKFKRDSKASEPNATTLAPRLTPKGGVHSTQNRLLTYASRFFGMLPSEQAMFALHEALVEEKIFSRRGERLQLNWDLLRLTNPEDDWFRCPNCRHIFHIPGLEAIDRGKNVNTFSCPSYKCLGNLLELQRDALPSNHYKLLIERTPLPLRSMEHTAQLETDELSDRENRFRRGLINLLSSSTTLEMGVDIGELQVVAMRNFPPFVSNYQQRAGRAGRRTDGVAVTLMYGQRRPHDRYYFDNPGRLIDGSNQVPSLDPLNFDIQQRHIRAELLARFLHTSLQRGAEKVNVMEFIGLPDNLTVSEIGVQPSLMLEFLEWLQMPEALKMIRFWLDRLGASASEQMLINAFRDVLEKFCKDQQEAWNDLAKLRRDLIKELMELLSSSDKESAKRQNGMVSRKGALEAQLRKVGERQLHEQLATSSILPIYGFPVDVVQLLTQGSSDTYRGKGRHRLQRDRRLALGEYSPGQDIVVDDRVHRSVGVVRAGDIETNWYWICCACNYFTAASTSEAIEERLELGGEHSCPVCRVTLTKGTRKPKAFKVPRAFTTDWSAPPSVTPHRKPVRQSTSQVFLAQANQDAEPRNTDFVEIVTSKAGEFFLSNQGPNKALGGFQLCRSCGLDLSRQILQRRDEAKKKRKTGVVAGNSTRISHLNPITQSACEGRYDEVHLAHRFRSDLVRIRFAKRTNAPGLYATVRHLEGGDGIHSQPDSKSDGSPDEQTGGVGFWRSLTYAVLAAAAQVIDVPRSELDGLFRPVENQDGVTELIIYDNVPSGAGHSQRIGDRFEEVLMRTMELVSSCSCASSCYDCLRTYTNQLFHEQLDRRSVQTFLQPIVAQLFPDERQISFAPHASRINPDRISAVLNRAAQFAEHQTLFALQNIKPPFSFSFLTKTIDRCRDGNPPTLILRNLPPSGGEEVTRVLRKRLAQWIDQGLLDLLCFDLDAPDTAVFASDGPHRAAIQLVHAQNGEALDCLETRSPEGVEIVLRRLHEWRSQARPVAIAELADEDTRIVFPGPRSKELMPAVTSTQLAEFIGLPALLKGRKLAHAEYTDRYFDNQDTGSAELLVGLLTGPWLVKDTTILVRTAETEEEHRFNDSSRRTRLKTALHSFPLSLTFELDWRHYARRRYEPRLKHARELTLHVKGGDTFRVLFDRGLDFARRYGDLYKIREESYVVITKS